MIDATIRPCTLDSRWLVMQTGSDSWFMAGKGIAATITVRRLNGAYYPVVTFADGRTVRCRSVGDAIAAASW